MSFFNDFRERFCMLMCGLQQRRFALGGIIVCQG
jgi:hypothetical protein